MNQIRVILVEDNLRLAEQWKRNLALFPEINLLGVANNGRQAMEQVAACELLPDIVLMDIQMPLMDGISATAAITEKYSDLRVVMFTVFEDEEQIFQAISAGASGYLLKDTPVKQLVAGLQQVVNGGAALTPRVATKTLALLRDQFGKKDSRGLLTERESEVLRLMAMGKNYREISEQLVISGKTVRKHMENMYRKLNAHNKIEAIRLARELRLV